jgi:hypothetical protein
MKIDELIESNASITQYVTKTIPEVSSLLQKSKFQATGNALLSLVARSGYLNNEVLFASSTGNLYSCAVLFRPMIEHNFRHLYMFVRALNDDSDEVGKRYYGVLRGDEDRQAVYNINKYTQKVYPENTKWDLGGDHNKSIRCRAKEFRIDEIFYYLVENNNDRTSNLVSTFKKEYLLERLRQYTNLSSSVHGGPFGEATLLEAQKNNIEVTLIKFATDSLELHKSLIETTYLFADMMDNNNQKWYEEIKKIL